jgi:hypothetical protein
MQIHEITKRQRIDEGLLGDVKNAITRKATAVYKDKTQAIKDKVAAVKNIPTQAKQDYLGGVKAAKRSGEDNNLMARMAGVGNIFTKAGDRWQEKQWDKTQDTRNSQAADAAKILARKGFKVDTTTPAARAQTPTRVKQQKLAQLQQAFDQEFELMPNAAQMHAQQQAAKAEKAAKAYAPKTQQNIAAQNKQMSPQSGIKEAQVDPNKLATMKARAKAPGVTQPNNDTTKKDIATEFPGWIRQKIPGLDKAPPEVTTKLNGIFSQMKIQAGKNPKAVDQAFQQYADLALSSVAPAQDQQRQQGQQAQGGADPSAGYARNGIANSIGLDSSAVAALQQRIIQNKEPLRSTDTGSPTVNKLIQALLKK